MQRDKFILFVSNNPKCHPILIIRTTEVILFGKRGREAINLFNYLVDSKNTKIEMGICETYYIYVEKDHDNPSNISIEIVKSGNVIRTITYPYIRKSKKWKKILDILYSNGFSK